MALSNNSLQYFLVDSLRAYTEDFQVHERTNPVAFEINGSRFSVHISSVHDSGKGRTNEDEQRIQIRRTIINEQRRRRAAGAITLFIGFFLDGEVFTAWEPDHVFAQNPISGGTVYARFSHQVIAANDGGAIRVSKSKNLGRKVRTLSFRTEALGFYLENWRVLHAAQNEQELLQVVATMASAIEAVDRTGETDAEVNVAGERRTVTTTRTSYARDPKFSREVLKAYDGKCCICDRQLGLVEAAHIVPHGHPDGLDHVTNGLALCVEHHRLYDSQLLLPTSGRQLFLNPDRVEHLRNIGQDSGLDAIEALAAGQYRVPEDVQSRPDDGFLERGVRIRLGTDV